MACICLISGKLSDIIGRKKIYVGIIFFICISISNLTYILEQGDWVAVYASQIVLAIFAAAYIGPEPSLQAEFYPANVRATALSISYNLATSIFGGTTPWVMQYLIQKTGSIASCAYYLIFASFISLIGIYFYKSSDHLAKE
jgi:MHS family proline/betaine transporter-like MFS transporter